MRTRGKACLSSASNTKALQNARPYGPAPEAAEPISRPFDTHPNE
jgi:hypothetical protein